MTNKIANDIIMETLRTSVASFNHSAPAEFAIFGDEYQKFCDKVISQIKATPVTSISISTIGAIITDVLTKYAEDKLGIHNVVLNIDDMIESGELRRIADNTISDGNLRLFNQGYKLRLDYDTFYDTLVELLRGKATNGEMQMMELNQTTMTLLCQMTDEMVASASQKTGYVL